MKQPLFTPHEHTPLFNATLEANPITDPTPQGPTKRQRHKAAQLTKKVVRALETNPTADTSALTVTTQELPEVA